MDKKLERNSKTKISKDKLSQMEINGKSIFKFPNGDVYAGNFKATKKEEIFRNGSGKYFCEDGSVYEGTWNNDYLEHAKGLNFPNNDTFKGPLKNFQFSGNGIYVMSRVGIVETLFENNYPLGDVILTDPYGFCWKGVATKESNEAILYPTNHFKIDFNEESGQINNLEAKES